MLGLNGPERHLIGPGAALLGLGQRGGFDEQTLPLVALAAAAEADHDRGQLAGPVGAAGEPGVARGQENQVVHARTTQAYRAGVLHEQQVTGSGAGRARPVLQWRDDDEIRRAALALGESFALGGGQLGGDPVRAVRAFDLGRATDAEAQRPAVPSPGDVTGLARYQAALLRPAAVSRPADPAGSDQPGVCQPT